MKTTELIEFLKTKPFTHDQAYNLLIADIYEAVTEEEIATHPAQKLVAFFMYQIQEVLLPVIDELKKAQA